MKKTFLAIVMAIGLVPMAMAQTATGSNGDQTKYAVSPDSGKARSTPDTTLIPGPSTTGNATGPAAGVGADRAGPEGQASTPASPGR